MNKLILVTLLWCSVSAFANGQDALNGSLIGANNTATAVKTSTEESVDSLNESTLETSNVEAKVIEVANKSTSEAPVEVGKHVTANMDALSMIISLLMVLAVIVISAMILKRFQQMPIRYRNLHNNLLLNIALAYI